MRLSTRLMLAMTALVLGTAAGGVLGYQSVETAVLPVSLDRLAAQAKARLGVLDIYLRGVRGDVLALRAISAHDGLVRARQSGGVDPVDRTTEATWRERVEATYLAQLSAKPAIQQMRLIGIADGGREIVRVDRTSPGGPARVVPDAGLQRKGERPYYHDAIAQPAGEVYVSPIDLNQEYGTLEVPHVPVQRFSTLITDAQGRPFGIFIVNLDIRHIFDGIRAAADTPSQIYVVNEAGDFLLHPDPDRIFGFDLGRRDRWQSGFPELAAAVAAGRSAAVIARADGERVAAGMATIRVADGPPIGIIAVETCADIMAPALALRRSALWTALLACGIAIVLAALMARSLTRPLRRITAAVEGFAQGAPVELSNPGNGEIGILAAAFTRMARDVDDKAAALRDKSELFDKTIESMADGFVIIGAAGETVYANAAARALIGGREPDFASPEWQSSTRNCIRTA